MGMTKDEFDAACRDLEPTALIAIERAMQQGGAPALKAAELLLAYTQGKPLTPVQVGGEIGVVVNILRFGEDSALPKQTAAPLIDVTPCQP